MSVIRYLTKSRFKLALECYQKELEYDSGESSEDLSMYQESLRFLEELKKMNESDWNLISE